MFEPNEYACVILREDVAEYVIFIHSMSRCDDEIGVARYTIEFTKSCSMDSIYPLSSRIAEGQGKGLTLNFKSVEKMGRPEDAGNVWLDAIVAARNLDFKYKVGVE